MSNRVTRDDRIREAKRVSNLLALFDGFPEDYDEFVTNEVLPTYIFYNGKKGTGYCTTCRSEFSVKGMGLKHKYGAICPACGRKATARSEGMSRTQYEIYWSEIVTEKDGRLLLRYIRHEVDYYDYRNPGVETMELFRTVVVGSYINRLMWWSDPMAGRHNWIAYNDRQFDYNPYYGYFTTDRTSEYYLPTNVKVYGDYFSAIKHTLPKECQYIPLEELCALQNECGRLKVFNIEEAVAFYKQFPFVEQLIKAGFGGLVKCLMTNKKTAPQYFDATQSELVKILKLDRPRYEILKSVGEASLDDLKILQLYPQFTKKDFYFVKTKRLFDEDKKWLRKALEYSSLSKIIKYADKQEIPYSGACYYSGGKGYDYMDYMRFCETIGRDLHDEYYLFPKDLKRAHDEAYMEQLKITDPKEYARREQENALVKMTSEEKSKFAPFGLHYCGLFIRLPKDGDEIKREGEALHHCVGGYVSRVANGQTTILFVRKESEPDKPFYTMEWKGKIVQLRGAHNCSPTEEVENFRKEFEKAVTKEYKKTKNAQKVA